MQYTERQNERYGQIWDLKLMQIKKYSDAQKHFVLLNRSYYNTPISKYQCNNAKKNS